MSKLFVICFFALSCQAQQGENVERLFTNILNAKNSKEIVHTSGFKSLHKIYDEKALVYLAKWFDNPSETKVYSDCHTRFLNKGEVAIIVADRIQMMPYFSLTGIENCILSHCENNSNSIEYYFPYIQSYINFQAKYYQHLRNDK